MSKGRAEAVRHPLQTVSEGERIVIVGTGESGSVAYEYFSYDSSHEVVAFSDRAPFIVTDTHCGLPMIPLEQLSSAYPPDKYRAFAATSATELNHIRGELYREVKAVGFTCVSYVSTHAFALPNVEIGENTFVQENAALQNMTRLGNNVFLGSGSCIGHSSVIEDDCYVAPHATVCGNCTVGSRTFLGANSCIAHSLSIAEDCVIGAGAIILKDTVPRQAYFGNPAHPVDRESSEAWPVHMA